MATDAADPELLDGTIDIHHAVAHNNSEDIKRYVLAGGDLQARDKDCLTPLHVAAAGGLREVVEYLMKNKGGASLVDLKSKIGHTPLHLACRFGHLAVVVLLLAEGADINSRDTDDNTPLHKAASNGKAQLCRELVKRGADIDARNATEYTPLHWACFKGHKPAGEQLLKCGANINATSSRGATALFMSTFYGHVDVTFLLLAWGADSSIANEDGVKPCETFLHEVSEAHRNQTRVLFSERQALLMKGYEATRRNMALMYMRSERSDLNLRMSQGEVETLWGKLTKREKELNMSKVGARDLSKAVKAMKTALEQTRQDSKITRERMAALEAEVQEAQEEAAVQRKRANKAERALEELRERVNLSSSGFAGDMEAASGTQGNGARKGQGKGQSSGEGTSPEPTDDVSNTPTGSAVDAVTGFSGAQRVASCAAMRQAVEARVLRSSSFSSSENDSNSESSVSTSLQLESQGSSKDRGSPSSSALSSPVASGALRSPASPASPLVPSLPSGRIAALASAINTRVAEQGPTATLPFPVTATTAAEKTMKRSGSFSSLQWAGGASGEGSSACEKEAPPSKSTGLSVSPGSGVPPWAKRMSSGNGGSGGSGDTGSSSKSDGKSDTPKRTPRAISRTASPSVARRGSRRLRKSSSAAEEVVGFTNAPITSGIESVAREASRGGSGGGGGRGGRSPPVSWPKADSATARETNFLPAGVADGACGGGCEGGSSDAVARLVDFRKDPMPMGGNEDGQGSINSEETVPASPETVAGRSQSGRSNDSGNCNDGEGGGGVGMD